MFVKSRDKLPSFSLLLEEGVRKILKMNQVHFSQKRSPVKVKKCFKCKKPGHFAAQSKVMIQEQQAIGLGTVRLETSDGVVNLLNVLYIPKA